MDKKFCKFTAGLATVFLEIATVETDFFAINRERNCFERGTGFSLERTMQARDALYTEKLSATMENFSDS